MTAVLRRFVLVIPLVWATSLGAAAQASSPSPEQMQSSPPIDTSTTERNRQVVAEAFARWAAGGRTFFRDLLATDVVWTIKGTSPAAGTYRGRDDFIDRAVTPFAERLRAPVRPTVKAIWADGDHVVVYWDGAGIAADGLAYENSYVWIFRMAGRRAVEVVAFLDLVPYDDVLRRVARPPDVGKTAPPTP